MHSCCPLSYEVTRIQSQGFTLMTHIPYYAAPWTSTLNSGVRRNFHSLCLTMGIEFQWEASGTHMSRAQPTVVSCEPQGSVWLRLTVGSGFTRMHALSTGSPGLDAPWGEADRLRCHQLILF